MIFTAGTPDAQYGVLFVMDPLFQQHVSELGGGYGAGVDNFRPKLVPRRIMPAAEVGSSLPSPKMKVKKPFFPTVDPKQFMEQFKKSKEQFKEKLNGLNVNPGQGGLAFAGVPNGAGRGNKPFGDSSIFSNFTRRITTPEGGSEGPAKNKLKSVGPPSVPGKSRVEGTGQAGPIKEVEIVDRTGKPIGELDEIDLKNNIFYEDKAAKGLDIINPKTGSPAQTPQQFADKQILGKTRKRINNIAEATATRATKNGTPDVPTLDQIKGIRRFIFRLDGDTPELRQAVENSLKHLRKEFLGILLMHCLEGRSNVN